MIQPQRSSFLNITTKEISSLTSQSTVVNYPLQSAARIKCAVQIAEGLAHLYSKNVEWYDAHLANVLKTDDGIVICDFASSFLCPPPFHYPDFVPPAPYALPTIHFGQKFSQDIFAFGVIFFVLLTGHFPHALTSGLNLDANDCGNFHDKHEAGEFDSLTHQSFSEFGPLIQKCFLGSYESGKELLSDLKQLAVTEKGSVARD